MNWSSSTSTELIRSRNIKQTSTDLISLAMGDQVFLKLQPYAQSSVTKRANHELNIRYFGPYTVLARVGQLAYRLSLPAN
jgi:hypothetical protein